MRKLLPSITCIALLIACLALAIGCTMESPAPVSIGDFKVKTDLFQEPIPPECPLPRPKKIGCTTLCKPCIEWFCQDGKWMRIDLGFPDEFCERDRIPQDQGPFACPRTSTGFCPSECSICF